MIKYTLHKSPCMGNMCSISSKKTYVPQLQGSPLLFDQKKNRERVKNKNFGKVNGVPLFDCASCNAILITGVVLYNLVQFVDSISPA